MSKKNRPKRARPDYPSELPGLRSDGALVLLGYHPKAKGRVIGYPAHKRAKEAR